MEATQKEKGNREKKQLNTLGSGQGKKLIPSFFPISSSPHKGESSQNKYAELVNLEETQEETREVQDEHEETVKSGQNKQISKFYGQGNSTPRKGNPSPSKIPETVEDRHLEGSGEDSESEISQSITTRKVGRKSNRNRRETKADREKELGIQTTLEEILKKDGKSQKSTLLSQRHILSTL
jgi:hypothetical protein